MGDHLPRLQAVLRRLVKDKKKNILSVSILVLVTGLFFSVVFEAKALAKRSLVIVKTDYASIDPLAKIGKSQFPQTEEAREKKLARSIKKNEYQKLVEGHPIETMVGEIAKKDKAVAAFLIGIAKKESNWGKHSPKKDGRDCYNYWGYRGGYNPTDSGYSCFDSPEQAIAEVGGRIEKLLGQKINTPERMIVWKCGRTCAGHDPESVKKWIADVSLYYDKLSS